MSTDTASAPPGSTEMTVPLSINATLDNTTDGHDMPLSEDGISDGEIVLIVVFPQSSPICSQMIGNVVDPSSSVNGGCYTGVASLVPPSDSSTTGTTPSGTQLTLAATAVGGGQPEIQVDAPEGNPGSYVPLVGQASLCLVNYVYWSDMGIGGDVDHLAGCARLSAPGAAG